MNTICDICGSNHASRNALRVHRVKVHGAALNSNPATNYNEAIVKTIDRITTELTTLRAMLGLSHCEASTTAAKPLRVCRSTGAVKPEPVVDDFWSRAKARAQAKLNNHE